MWGLLDHIKGAKPQKGSFADLLLRARDAKTGAPLTDAQMMPEIAALFFAGIDTTGHTGCFVLCAPPLSLLSKPASVLQACQLMCTLSWGDISLPVHTPCLFIAASMPAHLSTALGWHQPWHALRQA